MASKESFKIDNQEFHYVLENEFKYSIYNKTGKKPIGSLMYHKRYKIWVLKIRFYKNKHCLVVPFKDETPHKLFSTIAQDFYNLQTFTEFKRTCITISDLVKELLSLKKISGNVQVFIKLEDDVLVPLDSVEYNGVEIVLY